MKVSELTGIALNWAVAKCKGGTNFRFDTVATYWITINGKDWALSNKSWAQSFAPSTDWAQGGEIIERERISVISVISDFHEIRDSWMAENYDGDNQEYGPTPLIAAMRVYVASKLGDEIEIPNEIGE